jgi:putative flippase GtrA
VRIDQTLESKVPEIWKIVKWLMMSGLASIVELGVHFLLQFVVFAAIYNAAFSPSMQRVLGAIGLNQGRGAFFSFLISITIGYTIAYILNRKVTFKSATNLARSTVLYALMVVFTILAGAWIGTAIENLFYSQGWDTFSFLIKPIQMAIPGLWTYPMMRFVVLRPAKKQKQEEPEA